MFEHEKQRDIFAQAPTQNKDADDHKHTTDHAHIEFDQEIELDEEIISSHDSSELRSLFNDEEDQVRFHKEIENKSELQAKFNAFVEQNLNAEQQKAVTQRDGSFLVIAGAGSGKTRVITARITHLILNCGVEPSSIIALTFTNKAAQEMQHRIEQFLPNLRTKPHIATFHAYCLKLLKKNAALLKANAFSVIDSQDALKLLQAIVKDRGLDKLFNPKQLLPMFSSYKMNETLHLELPTWNMHHAQQFMELYNAYEQQKRQSNYLDFDDLLYKTFHLFDSNPNFKENHIKHHRHLLVDEYQDTNLIQHELLKQMTVQGKKIVVDSVCAVGDEDQSIYSWRGATVKNILEFNQEFQDTKTFKLEQNYRSTQQILDVANSIIKNNVNRNHKQLWSSNSKQHQPMLLECLSDLQEAYSIAHLINLVSRTEKKSSIAILYRTHYQSRIIEEALIKESIPYKIIGGIQFYERKEIKDLLAYLRLLKNPFDRISFFRAINCPLRGLGEKFEEVFLQTWNENPLSTFKEVAVMVINHGLIPMKQIASVQSFTRLFDESLLTAADEQSEAKKNASVVSILEHFIKKTEYISYLIDSCDKAEAETKRENVAEFIRAAEYFDEHNKSGLSQFLDDISLMQEQIKKDDASVDRISMMTLHSAKGLEFSTVILVGLEEGILPSNQSIGQENVEEERRLFYVGITRAREKLLITHSKHRNVYGKMDQQRPSRFLSEIPQHLMVHQEAANWTKSSFTTFFQDWLSNQKAPKAQTTYKPDAASSHVAPQTTSHAPTPATTNFVKSSHIRRLQAVKHVKFGLGIAHHVEQKGEKTVVTVHFTHHGTKKIDSSFLEIV